MNSPNPFYKGYPKYERKNRLFFLLIRRPSELVDPEQVLPLRTRRGVITIPTTRPAVNDYWSMTTVTTVKLLSSYSRPSPIAVALADATK